jgi:hypothetical protein
MEYKMKLHEDKILFIRKRLRSTVNGNQECSDFGIQECSVFGNNSAVKTATMLQ